MRERLWSPIFITIVVCTLCCFLMGQGSNAGTTVYLERTGGNTGLAGVGAFAFSLAAALSRIVAGPLADARGRRLVAVIGAVVMLVGTVGPLFGNAGALFIFWRLAQGFGFAASTTALATAAADVLPFSRLGEGIGYYGLGQAVSMSIGPALAIFLISTDVPENFYIGLAACSALALITALLCRYERNPQSLPQTAEFRMRWQRGEVAYLAKEGAAPGSAATGGESSHDRMTPRKLFDSIFEPAALPGSLSIMAIATSFGFGIFFMGVFGSYLGVANAGIFYTVSACAMIVVRLVSGKFMDRVRPIVIMGVAVVSGLMCFGMMLGCSLAGHSPVVEQVFYWAGIPYGISLGIALPINQTVAVRLSPASRWGAANGLFLLCNDVAIGIASMVWGFLVGAFGYTVTLGAVMCMIALSFFVALACYPKGNV